MCVLLHFREDRLRGEIVAHEGVVVVEAVSGAGQPENPHIHGQAPLPVVGHLVGMQGADEHRKRATRRYMLMVVVYVPSAIPASGIPADHR